MHHHRLITAVGCILLLAVRPSPRAFPLPELRLPQGASMPKKTAPSPVTHVRQLTDLTPDPRNANRGTDRGRAQLPAIPGKRRPGGQLSRLDCDVFLQPAGGGHLQVLRDGLRRTNSKLRLRHRLPDAGASAAQHARVSRYERGRLLTGSQTRQIVGLKKPRLVCSDEADGFTMNDR
jgi:hypothetical protein